jgi:hypothetical protein
MVVDRQNFIVGILIGLSGGLYTALNLLGAGGGKPNSAQVVQVANATLCAVYAIFAFFGGSVLNTLGPALTAFVSERALPTPFWMLTTTVWHDWLHSVCWKFVVL